MNQEELIQDYLHGRLTPEEKAAVEFRISREKDFQAEVQAQKDLQAAFSAINKESLRHQLIEYEQEYASTKSLSLIQRIRKPKIWLSAAAILLLFGFGWAYFLNKPTSDKIFQNYFEIYPNVEAPVVRGVSDKDLQQKAFYAYSNDSYVQAVTDFKALYQQTQKSYYLFYQANALLALNQAHEAIPLLEKQLSFQDDYSPKSKWYLALAYLKTGQQDQAIKLFQEIKTTQSFNHQEASELLHKLR